VYENRRLPWLGHLSLIVLIALAGSGCSWFRADPDDTFADFASALSHRDASGAADLTTDPAAAASAITGMFDGLGDNAEVAVVADEVESDGSSGRLTMSWTFGPGKELRYETRGQAVESDGDWRLVWDARLLHDHMRPDAKFLYADEKDLTTPVVDRGGAPLLDWQTVGVITVLREAVGGASAALTRVLRRFDPTITDGSIRAAAAQQQGDAITVVTLRAEDVDAVRESLEAIDGVTIVEQGKLLTTDRALRSPVLSDIEATWNDAITERAGWSVTLVDDAGAPIDQLMAAPPRSTEPVQLSVDRRLQLLAQRAVGTRTEPTALVAIAPSTGGILAVAQNPAADRQGAIALSGLYPPGSTFKTVTTAAALSGGIATPQTPLPCPGRATIEGRTIPNEDDFELGTVPLTTAFARSCNTTMATLSNRLGPDALPATATQLGLGVDFVVPGITTVTGAVPRAGSPALRVENGIGQGEVTASPFGMAVAEASLGHGSMVLPTLISGRTTTANTAPEPLDPAVVNALRAMMRQTVATGTASQLGDIDGLGGKTGTAEYGDNTRSHGWFAGIVGDIAFATLVVGGDSSAPAVAVSGEFLRAATGR
jgi:hypothetical protein